ncbi:DUF1427 family protein [Burkholderia vietnamiensis]|uniref:DUF1427 family protein n=1 Tax=Burkholderia vietnamiensis TaxID=60552 RepID=UPI0007577EAB|nr:DUF1427 family protein [Burkholderia vietnamiensis]KVE94327.1 hypothetical protein WJ01_18755 [Burkholderia vietnamiensis]MBR7916149.1 DUF1427 family protein [Burkholderia vietnamiensis]HDR9359507.1 DUF1427 family protein [Burkholderia vietnamiensis]
MKPSVFSLLAGVLYGALELNSPAPPRFALTGLLSLLAGERLPCVARRMPAGHRPSAARRDATCSQRTLPQHERAQVIVIHTALPSHA